MLKLTNQQASALTSPAIQKLLADENRPFPTKDAFKLADILQQVGTRLNVYHKKVQEITTKHGGKVLESGRLDFSQAKNPTEAMEEVALLSTIELEYVGEKLIVASDWPKLTVAEAMLLKPVIDNGKS